MKKSTLYKTVFILQITSAIILLCATSCSEDGWKKAKGKAGSFTMTTFDSKEISSSNLEEKVVLLEFWDTHCGPCLELMPELVKLNDQFKDNPKVAIYVINAGWEPMETAKAFIEKKGYTFNSAYMKKEVSRKLGVTTSPATLIIGTGNNLKFKHLGFDEQTEMGIVGIFESYIRSLLK